MQIFNKSVKALIAVGFAIFGMQAQAALNTSKILVLEHSVVDLERNIEILRFDMTRGQNFCDVYASVYGSKRTSGVCNQFSDYTTPRFTAENGWRIGTGDELYDLFKLLTNSWYAPASWLTIYSNQELGEWAFENLGGTRIAQNGHPYFVATTVKNDVPSSPWVTTVDLVTYVNEGFGVRFSSGSASSAAGASTLLVRDWLGEERPLFGVPVPAVGAGLFGLFALTVRRKKSIK